MSSNKQKILDAYKSENGYYHVTQVVHMMEDYLQQPTATEDKSIEQMAYDALDKEDYNTKEEGKMFIKGFKANTVNAELLEALKLLYEHDSLENWEKAQTVIAKAEQLKTL